MRLPSDFELDFEHILSKIASNGRE